VRGEGPSAALAPEYNPCVATIVGRGSTSIIRRLRFHVVLKCPRLEWWNQQDGTAHESANSVRHSFKVEEEILGILGSHPRIIRFLGCSKEPKGLLFAEASKGSLQAYLDHHNDKVNIHLRMAWRFEAGEAVQYLHSKGVIHSDLRPDNYLLNTDDSLCVCDFGGSTCGAIDGGGLPDSGFFNPGNGWVSTMGTDIFSLGSVYYFIMTGHWPYKLPGPFVSVAEKLEYEERVDALFSKGEFPLVDNLAAGTIIHSCWMVAYKDVGAMLLEQETLCMQLFENVRNVRKSEAPFAFAKQDVSTKGN
ncbi:Serine/threonine-protein kinase HT1, partial [Lachnellula arida]